MKSSLPQAPNVLPQSNLLIGGNLDDAVALVKKLFSEKHHSKIDSRNHPDVHLYSPEGKSLMHSMASIQKLIREIALPPFEAPSKVFIIEDAEKMLPSSSNALLKTLEEPPKDTFFFLLSNHPELLLPTISSRLYPHHYEQKEIEPLDLAPYLSHAQKREWDILLEEVAKLDDEDPKAVLHGFLKAGVSPESVAKAQKALDHNVKPRNLYLQLFLSLD